jgi:hypothetical protein
MLVRHTVCRFLEERGYESNPTTASIPIIIVAGRASAADARNETRANYVIYKDIDVVAQLDKALSKIFASVDR